MSSLHRTWHWLYCSSADLAPTGKYIGTRPVKLRKSTWKERSLEMVRKKDRERAKLGMR